jgi:hypothetical protein
MKAAVSTGGKVDQEFRTAARRMELMTSVENGWRDEAYGESHPKHGWAGFRCDILLESFDSTNAEEVAGRLIAAPVLSAF